MNLFKNLAISLLLGVFILMANAASAEEGGGKAAEEGKELLAKVDAIVVNLMGPSQQYVQVEMTLKLVKPEVGEKVKLYMPVIRHKMILLLTTKEASQLTPTEGKQKLVLESRDAINQALGLTEKEGVADVLFSSFIIQ